MPKERSKLVFCRSLLFSCLSLQLSCLQPFPARAGDAGPAPAASDPAGTEAGSTTTAGADDAGATATSDKPGEDKPASEQMQDVNSAGSSRLLRGGVKGSAVRLEEGLVMIEASARMVQEPALEIAKECTRKETATARGPNYIGNGIVIPAIGNPNGTFQIGELPARKDRVDAFLTAAEQAIKALRTHVDGLIIPEGSSLDMVNLWKGMQSSMLAAENNITTMKDLVAQTPSKKGQIKQKDAKPLGRAALKVYDSMTALEKMRSRIDDMVKPELKGKE